MWCHSSTGASDPSRSENPRETNEFWNITSVRIHRETFSRLSPCVSSAFLVGCVGARFVPVVLVDFGEPENSLCAQICEPLSMFSVLGYLSETSGSDFESVGDVGVKDLRVAAPGTETDEEHAVVELTPEETMAETNNRLAAAESISTSGSAPSVTGFAIGSRPCT